jgi:hypothetical protein
MNCQVIVRLFSLNRQVLPLTAECGMDSNRPVIVRFSDKNRQIFRRLVMGEER